MDITHHLIDEVACLLHGVYLGAFDKTTPLHLRDALHHNRDDRGDYCHRD